MIPGFGAKLNCKENIKGDKCNECIDNFYGFPNCTGTSIGPGELKLLTNRCLWSKTTYSNYKQCGWDLGGSSFF